MKVYFNASLLGKEKYLKEFKTIIDTIKSLGHEVYSDHVMKRDYITVNKQTKKQHEADFQRARNKIHKSDVMIIEATQPSIGVGHTMTLALEMYKNVLVLYQNTPHGLLIGDPNRLLNVKRYSLKDPENLRHIIEIFMKRAQQRLLKKRFNLMLDVQQEDYLDWISKKLVVSKANYIRQLINDSIQKNKKYKKL